MTVSVSGKVKPKLKVFLLVLKSVNWCLTMCSKANRLSQHPGKRPCRLSRFFLAITELRIMLSLWITCWKPECHWTYTYYILIFNFPHLICAMSDSVGKDFIKIYKWWKSDIGENWIWARVTTCGCGREIDVLYEHKNKSLKNYWSRWPRFILS